MLTICVVIIVSIQSCGKADPEPARYAVPVPDNFPQLVDFADNPMTVEGIALGRMLFYDKRLSGNNQLSCASCHHPDKAFTDGVAVSDIGVSGKPLHRHSPALINLAWMDKGLFWDGGSTNLESQAFGPLTSADEMHQNLLELEAELKAVPEYQRRFQQVFRDTVKSAYIAMALAQFERTLVSSGSRYDQFKRQENQVTLTNLEKTGLAIVQNKCHGCHRTDLFTDNDFHNNGIDSVFSNSGLEGLFLGRARITYNPADRGKFKTPTLRNIMITSPYMHDGRLATIDDVLDHYSGKVRESATLDALMRQNNGKAGIPLTATEKLAIKAFLHTLTDNHFLTNTTLASPW